MMVLPIFLTWRITQQKIYQFLLDCLPADQVEEIKKERSFSPYKFFQMKLAKAERRLVHLSVPRAKGGEEYGARLKKRRRRGNLVSQKRTITELKGIIEAHDKKEMEIKYAGAQ
ncbi:uncharacterized protein LOC107045387 isoform X2 [Diachasma alloeum]|uniref:uncharacterized protein LOC107045387 isoform X2 n=1 Tax=Diachasma alloeum TaxID=454923 RepID=UPI000738227F|nr:uncharacterized protein LOC107045387 isoform X2 [Diachasma alloeum]